MGGSFVKLLASLSKSGEMGGDLQAYKRQGPAVSSFIYSASMYWVLGDQMLLSGIGYRIGEQGLLLRGLSVAADEASDLHSLMTMFIYCVILS